jgi:hypothetical protein
MNVRIRVFVGREEMMSFFSFDPSIIIKTKSTEIELLHNEVKGARGIDEHNTEQKQTKWLGFIIESVHFIKPDDYVGFYELFILWLRYQLTYKRICRISDPQLCQYEATKVYGYSFENIKLF